LRVSERERVRERERGREGEEASGREIMSSYKKKKEQEWEGGDEQLHIIYTVYVHVDIHT